MAMYAFNAVGMQGRAEAGSQPGQGSRIEGDRGLPTTYGRVMQATRLLVAGALLLLEASTVVSSSLSSSSAPAKKGSHVLFMVVDNLRPSLGAYGERDVLSPHIDALASTEGATLFSRAYCQEAWCSPSRNSFLTGRRPDVTRAWGFVTSFRDSPDGANWTTLPGWFKRQGYFCASAGKVFHPHLPANFDYPRSWSVQPTFTLKDDCDYGANEAPQ
jgi:hypothetical protein